MRYDYYNRNRGFWNLTTDPSLIGAQTLLRTPRGGDRPAPVIVGVLQGALGKLTFALGETGDSRKNGGPINRRSSTP